MILNYHDWSNRVQSITNTRQDNDITNRIGATYIENDTELWWPNGSGADCDEN